MTETRKKASGKVGKDEGKVQEVRRSKEDGRERISLLKKRILRLESELRESQDKLLRVMAEADNFKKRLAKEHAELVKYGHEQLVKELLPVLDDLDSVMSHCPHAAIPEVKAFVDGVALIAKNFKSVLSKFGVEEIEALDKKFDPNLHEAVSYLDSDNYPPEIVMAVLRKGYKLHDRVVRAAVVSVSKGPGSDNKNEAERVAHKGGM